MAAKFYYKLKTYIYRGNVRVDNPQMKLRCELLTVESPELKDGNKFNRATAETNVVIDWVDENGTNHATAAKAVYTLRAYQSRDAPRRTLENQRQCRPVRKPFAVVGHGQHVQGDPINWDPSRTSFPPRNLRGHDIPATNISRNRVGRKTSIPPR